MVDVKELSYRDMVNRSRVAKRLITVLSNMTLSLREIKHTSTCLALSTNSIFAVGQRKVPSSSMNCLVAAYV
jgi:hypothetical protein